MSLTRRKFLETSVGAGAGIASSHFLKAGPAAASPAASDVPSPVDEQIVPAPIGEWMTNTSASAFRAYRSKPAKTADSITWVQIDLGEPCLERAVLFQPGIDVFFHVLVSSRPSSDRMPYNWLKGQR